jgi:hypothetical protein
MRFKPAKGGLALPVGAHDILNMETPITLILRELAVVRQRISGRLLMSSMNYHFYL